MFSSNVISVSYAFVFLTVALEFLGLPFPGGILVAIAGAAVARGKLRLIPLICVAALGATAGETPWYFLGMFGRNHLLHVYCKFTLGSRACVANTKSFFHRFGILSLVFSKFFTGVRLFAAPMAGLVGYSFSTFLLLDLLGGVLWAGFFALAGKLFGPRSPLVISDQTIWILTIGPFLLFYLVRIIKRAIKGSAEELVESMADATH